MVKAIYMLWDIWWDIHIYYAPHTNTLIMITTTMLRCIGWWFWWFRYVLWHFYVYQHIEMVEYFLLLVPHLKLYGGGDSCDVWCSNRLMKLALTQLRWKVTAACQFHRSCWTGLARSIQVDQNPSVGIDPGNVPGRTRHCAMHSKGIIEHITVKSS